MSKANRKKDDNEKPLDDTDVVFEEEGSYKNFDLLEKVKKIQEKLSKCSKEKTEYLSGWQRAQADMINLKKIHEEDKRKTIEFANLNLIEDLLPVLDSFEMAFKNKEVWETVSADWRNGIEYIYTQFWNSLSTKGLSKIEPKEGDKFDPHFHDSAENVKTDNKDLDDSIVSVQRVGYMLGEKIIRPAKVKVYHFK